MVKHDKTPADKAMPEYKMFPNGMWHMLDAVMLMVFCLAISLKVLSELVSGWLSERALMHLELALLVVMVLVLATPTFFLTRGWSVCHRFLLWQNLVYAVMLTVGTCSLFFLGSIGMAATGAIGVVVAVISGLLYRSGPYANAVEHYRLIWAQHRAGSKG